MVKKNCVKCNKSIVDGIRFCPLCGAEQRVKRSSSTFNKTPFEILQVTPNAEDEVIKAAYISLAKKYHPDTLKNGTSEERMKELNWAYEEIHDPDRREKWKGEEEISEMGTESVSKKEKPHSKPYTPTQKPKEKNKPWLPIFLSISAFSIAIYICGSIFDSMSTRTSTTYSRPASTSTPRPRPTSTPRSTPTNTPIPLDYSEYFNSSDTLFYTGSGDYGSVTIQFDKYVFNINGGEEVAFTNGIKLKNATITVETFIPIGSFFNLEDRGTIGHEIWFRANEYSGYVLVVYGDRSYVILKDTGDDIKEIVSLRSHDSVHKSLNTWRIVMIGSNFRIYCNGDIVAEFTDGSFSSGFVYLGGFSNNNNQVRVDFDNLTIKE